MTRQELGQLISEAAAQSFGASRNALGDDQIIGYALMSHDTADSCGPVVATRAGADGFSYGPTEEFLYSPEEWDHFDEGPSFDQVNREIGTLYDAGDYEIDPDWHAKFRQLVFEANVTALEILVNNGFFGDESKRNSLFIVLCVSDSAESEKSAPRWAERLNTPQVFRSFMAWHRSTYAEA